MDACLSMIMANMGKVQKNMLVFDPFVGSGKSSTILSVKIKGCVSVQSDQYLCYSL